MKFTDVLQKSKQPLISLEVIPPEKGNKSDKIIRSVEKLMDFNPQFINVTNHQLHVIYTEVKGQMNKMTLGNKMNTFELCADLKNHFNVEPVPHLICGGTTRHQIKKILGSLKKYNLENIFVVRGDNPPGMRKFIKEKDGFKCAGGLIEEIINENEKLATFPAGLCIGAAGYPEKHYEALNLTRDMLYLKRKVAKGVDYIITQMFFDFDQCLNFMALAKEMGISIPIIPGIKPVVSLKVLKTIPRAFFLGAPEKLVKAFEAARTSQAEFQAGIKYMAEGVARLLDYGVSGIHFFTMGEAEETYALMEAVFGKPR
ncbi:methylenetetrahydrofolate reductase [Patescibacteria group bacterium]|nr:methylenetetrahydrofolate reductase [Patescibacteria group bacterium]